MASSTKKAIKRLVSDLEELKKLPVANVSAEPLEHDIFEWHCNIRQDNIIYHLILFFPQNYPYTSPSAEFVPTGFSYGSGATMQGTKGTKICLSIFSDFQHFHKEWASEKNTGWSPGYTVQTVLMNVVAFLADTQGSSHFSSTNLKLSRKFCCSDCGHCYSKPYPSLDEPDAQAEGPSSRLVSQLPSPTVAVPDSDESKSTGVSSDIGTNEHVNDKDTEKQSALDIQEKKEQNTSASPSVSRKPSVPQIIDYITKAVFNPESPLEEVYGFGLILSGRPPRRRLTTPCEFLTASSFYEMKASTGTVHSIMKEKLSFFLPLYISRDHSSLIKEKFEETMQSVTQFQAKNQTDWVVDMILETIPNLMCSTLVEFSMGRQHTSDNSLNGYFSLHRLLLWAVDTYPGLQEAVDTTIQEFVQDARKRNKNWCPDIGRWLMLLSVSKNFKWQDVASAYLSECHRRNVMWYVKSDPSLGQLETEDAYRLKNTFSLTKVSRKLLVFQVAFLDVAMPTDLTRQDVIERYEENTGFPTEEMVKQMKIVCERIEHDLNSYKDWFELLKLPTPTDADLCQQLKDAVKFANSTKGYHFS